MFGFCYRYQGVTVIKDLWLGATQSLWRLSLLQGMGLSDAWVLCKLSSHCHCSARFQEPGPLLLLELLQAYSCSHHLLIHAQVSLCGVVLWPLCTPESLSDSSHFHNSLYSDNFSASLVVCSQTEGAHCRTLLLQPAQCGPFPRCPSPWPLVAFDLADHPLSGRLHMYMRHKLVHNQVRLNIPTFSELIQSKYD